MPFRSVGQDKNTQIKVDLSNFMCGGAIYWKRKARKKLLTTGRP